MKLKELMSTSILEFLTGDYEPEDYVGLSVITDGLKAARDNVIGLCAVDAYNEVVFTILINGGDPNKTKDYHGIPIDKFATSGVSPFDAYSKALDFLSNKYIVMHNHKFGMKFLNEFTAKHNMPPISIPSLSQVQKTIPQSRPRLRSSRFLSVLS